MLNSRLNLNPQQIERKIKAIQKYFSTNNVMPHGFSKKIPFSSSYSYLLEYKPVNKKNFTPIYKLQRTDEIEAHLAYLCSLKNTINADGFAFFQSSTTINKSKEMEPYCKYIFQCAMRYFINILYNIPLIISQSKNDPQMHSRIIENLPNLMCYFISNEEYLKTNFFEIYDLFIILISFDLKSIFSGNCVWLQKQLLQFTTYLFPLIPVEERIKDLSRKISFSFMISELEVFVEFLPSMFHSPELFDLFQGILSGFIASLSYANYESCTTIRKIIERTLYFTKDSDLTMKNVNKVGIICFTLFTDCCKKFPKKLFIAQFDQLITFLFWITKSFADISNFIPSGDYEINIDQPVKGISLDSYIKATIGINSIDPIFLPSNFKVYTEKMATIIANSENRQKLIAKLLSVLLTHRIKQSASEINQEPKMDQSVNNETEPDQKNHSISTNNSNFTDSELMHKLLEFKSLVVISFDIMLKLKVDYLISVLLGKWNGVLFDEIFSEKFISDGNEIKKNIPIQNMILTVFYRSFMSNSICRIQMLNAIAEYISRRESIVPFMPLLNSLIASNENACFGHSLANSHLLHVIINLANEHQLLFAFLRTAMYVYPTDIFQSPLVCRFIEEKIQNTEYQPSMMDCIERGLCQCSSSLQSIPSLNQLLCHIGAILHSIILSFDGNSNPDFSFLYTIIEMVCRSIPSFHTSNLEILIQSGIFEIVATGCGKIKDKEFFHHSMELFSSAWRSSWDIQEKFNNPNFFINQILIKSILDETYDFDITNDLLNFSLNIQGYFGNSFALNILLRYSNDRPNEKQILDLLLGKIHESLINIRWLQRAKIVEHIFNRLESLKDDLVSVLLELLFYISKYDFSNSIFYSAIKLLKGKSFKFPHLVMNLFHRLLKESFDDQLQSCFFLDGNNTGIFGPNFSTPSNILTISTKIKPYFFHNSKFPLLLLRNEKKSFFLLSLSQKKLHCRFNNEIVHTFNYNFSAPPVAKLIIVFNKNELLLSINGKVEKVEYSFDNFLNEKLYVMIGCSTKKSHMTCFSGRIGPVILFDEYNPDVDYSQVYSKLPKSTREHVILCYNPKNAHGSKIRRVSKDNLEATVHGMIIQSSKTIQSVLPEINSLDNLLPLFLKLKGCEKCRNMLPSTEINIFNIDESKYCENCGCLDKVHGEEYLNSLLLLIATILAHTGSITSNLAVCGFNTLLSSLLLTVKPIFFSEDFLKSLLKLFEAMQFIDMSSLMVRTTWLNFEFFCKFDKRLQILLYSNYLYQAFQIRKEAFQKFSSYDFLIYRLINFFARDNEISNLAWKFAFFLFKQQLDINSAHIILATTLNFDNEHVVLLFLTLIYELISENNECIYQILQKYNYILPFVILLAKKLSSKIQLSILNIIDHFYSFNLRNRTIRHRSYSNCSDFSVGSSNFAPSYNSIGNFNIYFNDDEEDEDVFNSGITEAIVLINKKQNITELTNNIINYFISGKTRYLPLILRIIEDLPDPDFSTYINQIESALSNINIKNQYDGLWLYWLITFIHIKMKKTAKNNNNIGFNHGCVNLCEKDCARIFATQILNEMEKGNNNVLFELYTLFEMDYIENFIDYSELFPNILIFLLRQFINDQHMQSKESFINGQKELIKICFFTMFFQTRKDETLPRRTKYFDQPEFLTRLPFLNSLFCWFNYESQLNYRFGLNVKRNENANDEWKDFDLAQLVISLMIKLPNYDIFIGNDLKLNSLIVFSYILLHLGVFGYDCFDEQVKYVVSLLPKMSPEDANTCASILSVKSTFDFNKIILNNGETINIKSIPTSAVEVSLSSQIPFITEQFLQARANLRDKIITSLQNRLQVGFKSNIPQRKKPFNDIGLFLLSMQQNWYSTLNHLFSNFKKRQNEYDLVYKASSLKFLNVFIKELQVRSGPWSEPYTDLHFKAAKRTSPSGSRALMQINYTFDDHKTAQSLNQRLKMVVINKEDRSKNQAEFCANVNLTTLLSTYSGELSVTPESVSFVGPKKKIDISLSTILYIFKRTQGREDTAVEVYINNNKSYIFVFANSDERSDFMQAIDSQNFQTPPQISGKKFNFFVELRKISNGSVCQKMTSSELLQKLNITEKWQKRKISSFSYLFYLNILAGRSFNDISQYPVFPWIIADYESEKLDLNDPKTFRDLSKPLGAINEMQIKKLREAYLEEINTNTTSPLGSCLYRSHYSSPHLVCGFLIRMEPFTTLHVSIQGDQFDDKTRIFSSVKKVWNDIVNGTRDYRELVPEFFSNHHFLLNENNFDLQAEHTDVELPPWANGSPAQFVQMNREALESDFVSLHLNEWIDLIFGVKRNSLEYNNIYMPYSYIENQPNSPENSQIMQESALNFGICAQKIFDSSHPIRFPVFKSQNESIPTINTNNTILRIRKNTIINADLSVIWPNCQHGKFNLQSYSSAPSLKDLLNSSIEVSKIHKMIFFLNDIESNLICYNNDGLMKLLNISPTIIHSISVISGRVLLTGSSDGALRRWIIPSLRMLTSSSFHCYPIIACSGNGDLNIVVSIDTHFNMIYETLTDAVFIRNIALDVYGSNFFISVYKSGTVALIVNSFCSQNSKSKRNLSDSNNNNNNLDNPEETDDSIKSVILIFDIQGTQVCRKNFNQTILEYDKLSKDNGKEFLAVSFEDETIIFFSLPGLEISQEISDHATYGKFSIFKKKQAVLLSTEHDVTSVNINL